MYLLGAFYSLPVHLGHSARKYGGRRCFTLSWYILAIWGENVPAGGFLFSAGSSVVFFSHLVFWQFRANMERLGVVYSRSHMVAGFYENVRAWGCLFSGGRDWPFQAKTYCPRVFMLRRHILAVLGENVPAGGFLLSSGIFWPFGAKMYWPGVVYFQPVEFGHFGRKCTV